MAEEGAGGPLFVVAVDGSDPGERALAEAIRQGRQLHAELALVNVVVPTVVAQRGPARINMEQLIAEMEMAAADTVHAAAQRVKQAGLRARTKVLSGNRLEDVGPAIAGYAANHEAAMIFVGTHGRTGAARGHLGSVAEGLKAVATVPVSIVR
ncbi:MAG: universal stress protein [Actinomycetota bacterium]